MKKSICIILLIFLTGVIFWYVLLKNQNENDKEKFVFWSIQLKPVYEKEMSSIIKDFEIRHPEIKFIWVDIPIQEAQKRTLASVLSSNPADLINLNPDFSVILAQKNALEYFKIENTSQFNSSLVDKLKYKEKIYALPFYATSPVTMYNKEAFSKCLDGYFIETYEQLYETSSKLFNCSDTPVFVSSLNENDNLVKILNKFGITDTSQESENKAIEVYSMFNDMYKKGYLPKDILTINHREAVEKYMAQKANLIVAGSNFINMVKQNSLEQYKKSDIAPQLTTKQAGYDVALMNLIIPKKAKHKDLALEFALLLTNKQNQLKLAKLTNVLPANKYALEDEYFKNCSDDLVEKARCISANQLDNLQKEGFGDENKKTINEYVNRTLEEILLNKASDEKFVAVKVNKLFLNLKTLIKQ